MAAATVSPVETSTALVHHDSPDTSPIGIIPIVVPPVDIIDDHLAVSVSPPILPMTMAHSLHHEDSRSMPFDHDHAPVCRTVAGVLISHANAPGDGTMSNHDFA
jgi:hypothetical protein